MVEDLNPPQNSTQKPAIKPRITLADAEFIASQMARGLTETSAVYRHGNMTPNQWFKWKTRAKNSGKFEHIVERMKSTRLNLLVDNIEDAATGRREGVRHDWRAAQFLAGVIEPNFRPQTNGPNVTINNQTAVVGSVGGQDALAKLVAQVCGQIGAPAVGQASTVTSAPAEQPAIEIETVKD